MASQGLVVGLLLPVLLQAANPLRPQPGMADPHVHVWEPAGEAKRVWMYATHDTPASTPSLGFRMTNWWVWSSTDLVTWQQEDILWPTTTYAHANRTDCWATDAAERNGTFYFYLSVGGNDIGVVSGPSPKGPWHDPLGQAMIPHGLVKTEGTRDPGVLQDDDGNSYVPSSGPTHRPTHIASAWCPVLRRRRR